MNYNRGGDAHIYAATRIEELERALEEKLLVIDALKAELNKRMKNDQAAIRPRAFRTSES